VFILSLEKPRILMLIDTKIVSSVTFKRGGDAPDPKVVGAKAAALLTLPASWVPPFIVLTRAFMEAAGATSASILEIIDNLNPDQRVAFNEIVANAQSRNTPLLVRSNFEDEDIGTRGSYSSYVVNPNKSEIVMAIEKFVSIGVPVFPIIQRVIQPGVLGQSGLSKVCRKRGIKWAKPEFGLAKPLQSLVWWHLKLIKLWAGCGRLPAIYLIVVQATTIVNGFGMGAVYGLCRQTLPRRFITILQPMSISRDRWAE
jgi:hypothetical protein